MMMTQKLKKNIALYLVQYFNVKVACTNMYTR